MYHYRESGLPNIYLANGYREVKTAHGPSIVIEDVEGLHFAIAACIVSERKRLTGTEVRFIRKYLEKTQTALADELGVDEQTVRRWEGLKLIPTQADRAVRLHFLHEMVGRVKELPHMAEIVKRTARRKETPEQVKLRHHPRAREPWLPRECAVAC